jgi:hypothetical protein
MVLVGCVYADTAYSIPAWYSDKDGSVTGYVDFFLTNCTTGVNASCTLNIAITDTQANPTAAGQLVSGLSFALTNAGTALTVPGTLSGTINNNSNGNGTGGAVTVLDSSFNATTTTATPSSWQIAAGQTGFYLNDLTGGKPQDMIIGPGPYTNANPSITGHDPSLAGTVDFAITGFPGLTPTTVLSSVKFFFGTGPDASQTLTCTSNCGGPISVTGASATPEPFSLSLVGGGLLALALMRRRRGTAK